MDNLLTGTNSVIQPGVEVPMDTSTPNDTGQSNYSFWDWFQSVSGLNLLYNIASSMKGFDYNKDYNFLEYLYKNPFTGKSNFDLFSNKWNDSQIGSYTNDLLGLDKSNNNGISDDDLPSYLADIFSQGLEFFKNNVSTNYDYNSFEAEKERYWARLMRQTAYQDTMLDLKKAGINPLLAFGSFGPTSIPSGASASGSLANSNSLFSSMASSVLGDKKIMSSLITALFGIFRILTLKS